MASNDFQPVLIIGSFRAGTSTLYRVLARTGCFNINSALHLLNRHRLSELTSPAAMAAARQELEHTFRRLDISNRIFDEVSVDPDSPVEYAAALEPQRRHPQISPETLPGFIRYCELLQKVQDPARPLLLKNPYDTRTFLFINQAIPNARFVFIHRHPADIISSLMRAIRSVLNERNEFEALISPRMDRVYRSPVILSLARWLYGPSLPFLYWQVSHWVSDTCDYILHHRGKLVGKAVDLTYRELCDSPKEVTSRVLSSLKIPSWNGAGVKQMIRPRTTRLDPYVERNRAAIARRNAHYIQHFQL